MAKKKEVVNVNLEEMSLSELLTRANELAQKSNEAFENAEFQEAFDASKDLQDVIDQYAATKKDEVFTALKNTTHPMLEAVKQLRYEVIVAKESVPEGKHYKEKTVETKEKSIDLVALDKFCGGGIGANPEWNTAVKFLAACLVERHGADCETEVTGIKTSKAFTGVSAEIKEKVLNGRTPKAACSDKGLAETLNHIIELMIGEEYAKVTKGVAQFLLKGSIKKGRGVMTLQAVSNKIITEMLAEIMHCIILEKPLTIEHRIK